MTIADRLAEALKDTYFAAESSEACLKSWNDGVGGPANVEGILARAREALHEYDRAKAGGSHGWTKIGIRLVHADRDTIIVKHDGSSASAQWACDVIVKALDAAIDAATLTPDTK